MPAIPSSQFPTTVEYTIKGLADMVMDAIVKYPQCTRKLRTIALGALRYSDLYSKAPSCGGDLHDLRDLLQLRIYQIDYHEIYPVGLSAALTLVGKGTKDSVEGVCEPLDIFDVHWLG